MTRRTLSDDQALAQAKKLEKAGQPEQAKAVYGQILARNPQNKKARKALKALQGMGRSQLTQDDFNRVMQLAGSGRLEAARADASKLARAHPGEPAVLNLLGVILTRLNRPEEAIEQFREALALQGDFVDALNNLGAAYHKLGRLEEAEACYRRLLEAQPQDADTWFNLANTLRARGELQEAARCYGRSLELKPFSAEAYFNLGKTFSELGEPEQAIASYERALNIREDFIPARMLLGDVFASLGRPVPAGECFHTVLQNDPDHVPALLGLANAQFRMGSKLAAKESYARALELAPDNAVARHQLDAMAGRHSERAPQAYVRDVFDAYAGGFDQHLTGELGYDAPRRMRTLLDEWSVTLPAGAAAIDLGCGTGLAGEAFRDAVASLTGVDLSPNMLREARRKGHYDALLEGDALQLLRADEQRYGLFLSFDTLVYLGSLEALFTAIAERASPGALVLCSTEALDDEEGRDYRLLESARYAHSPAYVQRCAEQAGLRLVQAQTAALRKEGGEWIDGDYFCFAAQ